jgi:hypothetical protein
LHIRTNAGSSGNSRYTLRARMGSNAEGAILPISVKMFIADTDEEAREL